MPLIGSEACPNVHDDIASSVFSYLALNPRLRVTVFSSGVVFAFGLDLIPTYDQDPYVYLIIVYQRRSSDLVPLFISIL